MVRTKELGDTIWTKKLRIRRLSSVAATDLLGEDDQGRVLLVGTGKLDAAPATFLVSLNQATGDTLWTRTLTGPTAPDYTDLAWTSTNDYVLTANIEGRPYLVRMSAAGQITRQTSVDYAPGQPGGVTRMARGTGGYWVAVNSSISSTDSGTIKMVFVSDAGVRGTEYLTSFNTSYNASAPGKGIQSFLPVEGGNFLLVTSNTASKLSPTFTTLWAKYTFTGFPGSIGAFSFSQAQRTTSGNYLLLGTGRTSNNIEVYLYRFSPAGSSIGREGYFAGLNYGYNNTRVQVNPVTGQFALAVDTGVGADYEMIGLSGDAVLATAPRVATSAAQLYPNPVADPEQVIITAPVPITGPYLLADMQGRTVRSGRMQLTAPGRYALSLSGLTAGLYQLQLTDSQGHRSVLRVLKK
ncbi:T9SS type A sorting domain-containing protein [Hymenobacter terrestris]|uniref:T9SS type A sorting domain-containing protein n=1 Tax=Hymenobacter terrestris TaxID=2748310 RepID=A0ABX2Q7R6_9BACT|nr:T9SS type A sorting domain-containing protein [Hymenobacter terrestris]NVO86486.1 T9SS type A sorting domain-containing protein [Hymenobacter terrestris]